ncbi:Uncharacterised protein [Bordetella pertussis]|nr:Uncharacterised protein [Bordetella pertussis]CPJ49186.1 Uncharacterised protein [Bordetella pertussis]CPP39105.1 Uncharacterised protein [Bordetella pertussis]CPP88157.1 Uncharacterised protein [Bordetella pertussis]CRE31718.1 Uncharacterised protein [Bordetella pertussis]
MVYRYWMASSALPLKYPAAMPNASAGGSMASVVRLPMMSAVRTLLSACHSTSLPVRSVPSTW